MSGASRVCAASSTSSWHERCYGYVKPGALWCWNHDPEIQTPEFKAEVRTKVAAGRDRAKRAQSLKVQWCNWVGEGVPA